MDIVAAGPGDEALLLDLLNSTPVIDGVASDELGDPVTAQAWLNSHGAGQANEQRLQELIDVRNALQDVVRGGRSPQALQPFLDGVGLSPTFSDDGLTWTLTTHGTSPAAARAILAWDALRITNPGRLRPCANPECQLFLIDRSKPNTARWCSMSICGNRMKARRHYQRNKATVQPRAHRD
ncbi:CGNR zinc finger domain-containing protein [[Mycobacterium] vasticus]|uniref:CGNR zinc finger domain-containing protein n=1 Tax=[Mycobacterium] vasticus TaxID=2875777 RepID=A0ABU5YYM4_9MYCO|nr:CGNR zinc finger domain-containing protein [Mycolicibacter sp. MYC017]MEB3070239.1 CGNR zinc finger domain-containing protein [Mycolicibacter sp. MYC017]